MYRFALVLVLFVFSSCGLFSDDPADDPFDVEVKESFDIDFDFDASQFCPSGTDCSQQAGPSPGLVDLPVVELPLPVDILALTGSKELKDIANRLKKVEIESVEYELIDNSLNIDSPALQVYVAPLNITSVNANGAVELVTIPSVKPGISKAGVAKPKAENLPAASALFKALKFTAIGFVDKDIKKGEMFPPQGKVKYKLKFNLRFVANPVDQFRK